MYTRRLTDMQWSLAALLACALSIAPFASDAARKRNPIAAHHFEKGSDLFAHGS